ncbi:hypothetical protein ACPV5H_25360 [Vibrio harveyi]|uniref:hypothetical protein n=1 Tax=Vibrio harveyi group TaxID=717610 RepID=UPI000588074D|nr:MULTISPECIES: hypothetical protein [Vibrio harveyi group]EJG1993271.1 hypothetical protein [Vibrio parahaemolyticus]
MKTSLKQLVARHRGVDEASSFSSFELSSPQPLIESAKKVLSNVPPSMGACAPLSAAWAKTLRDDYDIPAIVVAGDLKILGKRIFKCKKNLPEASANEQIINQKWDGHCWIEIDGFVGDLSIFRTAYSLSYPSVLKQFIESTFGSGRGALLAPHQDIPSEMKYVAKYVLNDRQLAGLLGGLSYQLETGQRI